MPSNHVKSKSLINHSQSKEVMKSSWKYLKKKPLSPLQSDKHTEPRALRCQVLVLQASHWMQMNLLYLQINYSIGGNRSFFSFLQTAGEKRQKTDSWRKEDERCGNTREEAGWWDKKKECVSVCVWMRACVCVCMRVYGRERWTIDTLFMVFFPWSSKAGLIGVRSLWHFNGPII